MKPSPLQLRRVDPKQSSLPFPLKTPQTQRIFSHRKTASSSILQKKPQILLMKWNNFLQKYHLYKQLVSINNSLNITNTILRKKPQQLVIHDVPYIQSEQISIDERCQEEEPVVRESKVEDKFGGIKEQDQVQRSKNQTKIVVSIRLDQKMDGSVRKVERSGESQNFTDEEEQQSQASSEGKNTKQQSTNKNSKLQFSFDQLAEIAPDDDKQVNGIAESLRKTAFFSFSGQPDKKKTDLKLKDQVNQQNFNHLNKQIKSKKVQVLLKLHMQQQIRRQKAQKILQQDRQYLSKIMNRK